MIATDWMDYYEFIEGEAEKVQSLFAIKKGAYIPEDHGLPETHFYKKWKKMGRKFAYLQLTKKS